MKPILCLVETAVYADDLEASEQFYREILGLTFLNREAGRHVFFQVGPEDVLLIFHAETTLKPDHLPPHGTRGPGHFAMGIASEDQDSWRERLLRHNVLI